jgi:hypothetical protein
MVPGQAGLAPEAATPSVSSSDLCRAVLVADDTLPAAAAMTRDEDFGDQVALIDRLITIRKEVVFLVGAPISSPSVPGVSAMVELVRAELAGGPGAERLKEALLASSNHYQDAFRILIQFRGQDGANSIIRKAVLAARADKTSPIFLAAHQPAALVQAFETIEFELAGWQVTPGVQHLARVVVERPDLFGRKLLTTNFDPLLEVAIARAGGQFCKVFLHSDGALGQISTNACQVIHLHGDWCRSDTLHTPSQLLQPRPALTASLRRILEHCTLVVLAYGGWDDVFTRALLEVVNDGGSTFDVLWAFYDSAPATIRSRNAALLGQLAPGLGRGRVVPYRGIDAHTFLSELSRAIPSRSASTPPSAALVLEDVLSSPSSSPPLPASPAGVTMSPERELATRFSSLPFVIRTRIVEELGLVEATENPATDPTFFQKCFARARDKGLLAQLWDKVSAYHPAQMNVNPFSKR